MARYASGKYAYGISDRSGFRYRLSEMVTEWNGAKVGPDEYEAKHPQLEPVSPGPDPQALYDPRPDTNSEVSSVNITFPVFNTETLRYIELVSMKNVTAKFYGKMASKKAKIVFAGFDFSKCMSNELNMLDNTNRLFADNIHIAETKCVVNKSYSVCYPDDCNGVGLRYITGNLPVRPYHPQLQESAIVDNTPR